MRISPRFITARDLEQIKNVSIPEIEKEIPEIEKEIPEIEKELTPDPQVKTEPQPIEDSQPVGIAPENKKKTIPHAIRHILKKKR
jgi:hypothetical protein